MEQATCACGKRMSKYYHNSTIRRKQCPNCELKNKLSGADVVVKNAIRKKRKKTPRQKAMDRADAWFSKYIRLLYAWESNGEYVARCYTCGQVKHVVKLQLGHWQRRGYKTTRFHINDGRPQCVKCNYHHSGMPEVFELNLRKDIGDQAVDEIKFLAQQVGEDNEIFYREQSDKYRKLFNKLLKERQWKNPWKAD